jgi:cytoskeletal protein RodZ
MGKYRRAASQTSGKQRSLGPVILIGVGILILLVVIIWQLTLLPTSTAPQTSANFDIPYPEMKRVSLADAKTAYDASSALFVDVRDAGTFGSKHITGSINIPLAELENRFQELPKDRWIITVCT